MESVKEIKESTLNALKERFASPFFGYFIISWALLNWKSVYVTFFVSNEAIISQYNLLKNEYITKAIENNGSLNIITPLLGVLFFIFVFPHITYFVHKKLLSDRISIKILEETKAQLLIDKRRVTFQKDIDLKKLANQDPQISLKAEFMDFRENIKFFGKVVRKATKR